MPLVKATLKTALEGVFDPDNPPASTTAAANAIGTAYGSYAQAGQSCAMLPPSTLALKIPALQLALKNAFDAGKATPVEPATAKTTAQQADAIADCFVNVWTGVLFGVTGAITVGPIKSGLKSSLESAFNTNKNNTDEENQPTKSIIAGQWADALDAFTKTIQVKDTALPMPPGCGPSPIS